MSRLSRQNKILFVIATALIALCIAIGCLTVEHKGANADASFNKTGEITIGHFTDTHYYPYRLCYAGDITESESDDYFYNYIMDKSTKMWLEAEAIFDLACKQITAEAPDYLVLSGDVGQDGELLSHVDVANKLRKVQNAVRAKGKPNFQIFVVLGNHDLYNQDTFRFDNPSGEIKTSYYTTRLDAVQIYAGLGYPNMSEAEASVFYKGLEEDGLLNGDYGYVKSDLSSDFLYSWEFFKEDKNGKAIAYESNDDLTVAKMYSQIDIIDNEITFKADKTMCYRYVKDKIFDDIDVGEMTYIASRKDGQFGFVGMDVVLSNAEGHHVLGGQLQNATQDWMVANRDFAKPRANTIIAGACHHSVLPHWGMEEEITTGFIVYNWVEVSDFLADYGMRYVYTGHMHANDTVSKISMNGNQITDMETSSNVSVASMVKYTNINYGDAAGAVAEKTYVKAVNNKNLTVEDGGATQKLFNEVFKNDKYGYLERNGLTSFVNQKTGVLTNYSKYSEKRIYQNALVNNLNKFLHPRTLGMVESLVGGFNPSLAKEADVLVRNLVKEVNNNILKDYTYKGANPMYKNNTEMKIWGFVEEMALRVVNQDLTDGDDVNVFAVFIDMYTSHNYGTDVDNYEDLSLAYRKALANIKNGNFVDDLINALLDDKQGLMFLINKLATTTMDLSKGLEGSSIASLLSVVGGDLKNFNLGNILKKAGPMINGLLSGMEFDFENKTITEIVDDLVVKYVTDAFKQGLGEYAYNIAVSFGVDGGHNDFVDAEYRMLEVYKGEAYTYIDKTRADVATVDNGKLPSMITTNFGKDPSTQFAFTYYTDRRITDGVINLVEKTNDTKPTVYKSYNMDSEIIPTNKTWIDLGIWCQVGYKEVAKHTVTLTKLKPNTTYWYRLGNEGKGYYSEWFTFKTAPADKTTAFSALIGSDLQSSTKTAYERIASVYKDIAKVFPEGIDFMLNPGDVVDNGRNQTQFEWFLNTTDFYANHATVVSAGNHDNKYYEYKKIEKTVDWYGGQSVGVKNNEYNYLYSHYNYNLPDAQNAKTGFYYSFDYSGVHFVILNTNDVEENKIEKRMELGRKQSAWLVDDLKNSEAKHKVVLMHKSLYSAGSHSYDGDVIGMRAQLSPIFTNNGVNLVIAGHDHTYSESFYLDENGKKINTDANGKNKIGSKGTMYLTMGTMGDKFYNYINNENVLINNGRDLHTDEKKLSYPTFGKLVFDGEDLYYYGYQYIRNMEDGVVINANIVEIAKPIELSLYVAIGLMGLTVALTLVTIIVVCVKNKKVSKKRR